MDNNQRLILVEYLIKLKYKVYWSNIVLPKSAEFTFDKMS